MTLWKLTSLGAGINTIKSLWYMYPFILSDSALNGGSMWGSSFYTGHINWFVSPRSNILKHYFFPLSPFFLQSSNTLNWSPLDTLVFHYFFFILLWLGILLILLITLKKNKVEIRDVQIYFFFCTPPEKKPLPTSFMGPSF